MEAFYLSIFQDKTLDFALTTGVIFLFIFVIGRPIVKWFGEKIVGFLNEFLTEFKSLKVTMKDSMNSIKDVFEKHDKEDQKKSIAR